MEVSSKPVPGVVHLSSFRECGNTWLPLPTPEGVQQGRMNQGENYVTQGEEENDITDTDETMFSGR